MHIGFYAPLKPPDHPVASGDRRMAQSLMAALGRAGHEVTLAARFRSYDGAGETARQCALQQQGLALAATLIETFRREAAGRPDLWFTYHVYHKAPDWLGPRIAAALSIPYVVAEASFAPKRAGGAWDLGHRAAAEAIRAADAVVSLTRHDMTCLRALLAGAERLHYLPPFIDTAPFETAPERHLPARRQLAARYRLHPDRVWLLAVAMMRPGDKLESYRRLAAALSGLAGDDGWHLLLVGDGSARPDVEAAMATLGDRIVYTDALASEALAEIYAASDIYVWPAAGEAYGIALLEAQAAGLPVVAGHERGVPDVVRAGETGILCPPGDMAAFARAVRRLIQDAPLRQRLGRSAYASVRLDHDLAHAAERLNTIVGALVP